MNRRCRPSSFNDYPEDILPGDNLTCGETDSEVGFRLVHDDTNRVRRGSSWDGTADLARETGHRGDRPGFRNDFLGFRLVREEK